MRKSVIFIGLAVVVVGAQLVPLDRSNPPVEAEIALPDAVRGIVRKACYDCHSNETRWPWYAYVAPVSWLVHHDVEHAREHLNFSSWGTYSAEDQQELLGDIAEEVEEREMPLQIYVSLHAEARLTSDERPRADRVGGGERGSGAAERSGELSRPRARSQELEHAAVGVSGAELRAPRLDLDRARRGVEVGDLEYEGVGDLHGPGQSVSGSRRSAQRRGVL